MNKEPRITKNAVYCLLCKEEIESTHVHDYVSCSCGNISVDGGKQYLRRSGDGDNYEERSETNGKKIKD